MKLKEWFKEHTVFFLIYTLCLMIVIIILHQLKLTFEDIIYVLLWLLLPLLIYSLLLLYRKYRYYKQLYYQLNNLDKKYLLYEMLPQATNIEEQYLNDIIFEMTQSFNDVLAKEQQQQKDYYEYIQLWIHEIKLPLASLQLMIDNRHYNFQHLQYIEKQMDHLVQQVLFYAKSHQVNVDYRIQKQSSLSIVQETIAAYAPDLIQAQFNIDLPQEDIDISSDKQWLSFILGQLISNAIKYRSDKHSPQLTIQFLEDDTTIKWKIIDNGQGIDSKDLPYIFEKGYIGTQGRGEEKATGMGLYLCQKLCQQLNIDIYVTSNVGEYTIVTLSFPKTQTTLFKK